LLKKLYSSKRMRIAMVLILLSMAAIYYYYKTSAVAEQETVYREVQVTRGNITVELVADGSADLEVTNLAFQVVGKLQEILVEPGQTVKAGEVLARLDGTDYENKLTRAGQDYELNKISGQRQLDELKYQLDKLEYEYNAMAQIADCYTEKEMRDKEQEFKNARAAYEAQAASYEISLASAATDLKTAQDELNNTVLISPQDAQVLAVNFSQGETVPENETCIILLDDCKIKAVASVSEIDTAGIYPGQQVEAVFDACEDQVFSGQVIFIDSVPVKDSSGLVSYDTWIELEGGREQIKTGMTCTITFITKRVEDVLYIPVKAVSIADGRQIVQVKSQDGTVSERNISTGFTDGTSVEVIEGLQAGEIVLVTATSAPAAANSNNNNDMRNNGFMPGPGMGMGM